MTRYTESTLADALMDAPRYSECCGERMRRSDGDFCPVCHDHAMGEVECPACLWEIERHDVPSHPQHCRAVARGAAR